MSFDFSTSSRRIRRNHRTAPATIALVVLVSMVGGCSDSDSVDSEVPRSQAAVSDGDTTTPTTPKAWPIYRGTPSLEGVAPGTLADDLEIAWTFETGGAIMSSPAVVDGVVYFGSDDTYLHAVDAKTGKERWKFKTDDFIEAAVLVQDGRAYVGSEDLFLYAVDTTTGKLLWKRETGDKILGSANHVRTADGRPRIVVGSYDANLYCFDAVTGDELWKYQTADRLNGTPAIIDDKIVFGGCDCILHVVSATTGEPIEQVELGPESYVAASVALADGKVYLGHAGNEFVRVDLESTEIDWSYPSRRQGFFSSPAVAKDRVVFGGRDRKLHCVGRDDGKPLWTFRTRRKVDGSPVVCGDKVVFGSGDGRLYMLRLSDGTEVWKYEIGQPIFSSPAVADGMVFVGANDKKMYAFRARQ